MDKTKKIDMIKFAFFLVAAFAVFTFTHDLAKELLTSEFADVKHYYLSCKLLREGHNIWELSEQGMERAMEISRQINVLPPNHYPLPIHSQGFFLCLCRFLFFPIVWHPSSGF